MSNPAKTSKRLTQPLDRVAIGLMLLVSLLIGMLIWSGDHSAPRVREFSWQNQQVGAEDIAFILTFTRPMDHASVEKNLRLVPPLPGKVSWAGRRMAYTLTTPAPYGTGYQLELQGAQDRFTAEGSQRSVIQPFVGSFRTRDRGFVYIGTAGEEEGRLVLYNMTQREPHVLTPENLVVMEFKPYPQGDRILFSATERQPPSPSGKTTLPQGLINQQLYSVTTGIAVKQPQPSTTPIFNFLGLGKEPSPPVASELAGKVTLLLDSKDYQNLKFDLSADGQSIVVQRVNRKNPGDFGLWLLQPNRSPQPLKNQPGGDFLITPDSASLAIAQGQGLAILPLQPEADPLDFLPKFGMVLSFARDGSQAAMVKFNTDFTRSLFLVTNQGMQKEILRTSGSILNAQFDPLKQTLYCLLTQLLPGEVYQEQPFLAAIDLKTAQLKPLLLLPSQRNVQMSLSPDGLALLFDQPSAQDQAPNSKVEAKPDRLWLLPLVNDASVAQTIQPEELPFVGFHPRWLP
ncbi:MAG: Ig-like domain-containing protein [Leptolyngbyaceae bacterium]|nr:Ig-like domain-containing protein [Leptolyngbyaceae bacterium]